jgi:hypothetical protein
MNGRTIVKALTRVLPIGAALSLAACGNGAANANGPAKWPKADGITTAALPSTVSWQGVWFINTGGSRGTMHLFVSSDDRIHGCWLAEDRHARATFIGQVKDNVAKFDWTERRVGFAGPPAHVSAYLVMTPSAEDGRDRVQGEYGETTATDSGSPWEGVRQLRKEPSEDGCKLEEGDAVPTETKPLE